MLAIRRKLVNVLAIGTVAVAATLVNASPAAAAYPTCTDTGYTYSMPGGLIAHLPATSSGDTRCSMRQGNYNNDAVTLLQAALNNCGLVSHNLEVDGDYGPATKEAVRKEQNYMKTHGWSGVTVDGIYGPIWDRDLFYWPSGDRADESCTRTPAPAGSPVEYLRPLP